MGGYVLREDGLCFLLQCVLRQSLESLARLPEVYVLVAELRFEEVFKQLDAVCTYVWRSTSDTLEYVTTGVAIVLIYKSLTETLHLMHAVTNKSRSFDAS